MSVSRASLPRGAAIVTFNGVTLFTRDNITARHNPVWQDISTSMYGRVDKFKKDLVIKIPLKLWGAWENLAVLFPAVFKNPSAGASLFGTIDLPLVIWGRNNDRITYANAQLTKMSNLHLGVDEDLFSADCEFTCLIANSANPEDIGAYYVEDTSTYSDTAFAKTNFKRVRCTAAWGALSGFTAIVPQRGFSVDWDLKLTPVLVDGLGTVDMTIDDMIAAVKCVPIQPTIAQLHNNSQVSAPMGALLSTAAADFTITGSGISVVLKNAAMAEHGFMFGREPLRIGEVAWQTTRAFTAGVPGAVATVS